MGFQNFGKTQLGKYSANFNWEGAVKQPLQGLVNVLLDLSKYFMYEFYYKYIKRKYDAKLLFADTNSLVYEIKTRCL